MYRVFFKVDDRWRVHNDKFALENALQYAAKLNQICGFPVWVMDEDENWENEDEDISF